MPKSWDKRYQWILDHKEKLENKHKILDKKIKEIENQYEDELLETIEKINQSKANLVQQNNDLFKKHKGIQDNKQSLQKQIDENIKQQKKYAKKINKFKH